MFSGGGVSEEWSFKGEGGRCGGEKVIGVETSEEGGVEQRLYHKGMHISGE